MTSSAERPREAPQARPPRQRVLVAETITGRVMWEMPFTKFTWSSPLGKIGTATVTAPVAKALDELRTVDGVRAPDPRAALRGILSGPRRFSVGLCYGTSAFWGGPLLPNTDSRGGTIQIGASQMEQMLDERVLLDRSDSATGELNDPSRDVLAPATNVRSAMLRVANHAVTSWPGGFNRSLPLVCSNPPPTGGYENFAWRSFDRVTAWKAISDLRTRDDGPDVRLEPILIERDTGWYLVWDVQVGDPTMPANGPAGPDGPVPWLWDDTTADISPTLNPTGMCTDVFGAGSGQDRQKKIVLASDGRLPALGFPAIEKVSSDSSSQTADDDLESRTRAEVAAGAAPVDSWSLKVRIDREPPLGAVRRGDPALIDTRENLLIPPGLYPRRITALSGDESDLMTITSEHDDGVAA